MDTSATGLTAANFVADPYGPPGPPLPRRRPRAPVPDGELEFLGRTDDQVKVNGYRIEPAEIQGVLSGHTSVAEAFVTVRGREAGSPRLVAYGFRPGFRQTGAGRWIVTHCASSRRPGCPRTWCRPPSSPSKRCH